MKLILALTINLTLLALFFLYLHFEILAIALGTSLLLWFFYFLWRRQKLVEQRMLEKMEGHEIILPLEHILFRAVESSGYSQSTGMGYIALTKSFLFFEFILLDLVITVPIANLRGAEFVRRLKGVSPAKKMLRIKFINDKGENDSIAINVKDMELWKNTIDKHSSVEA